MVQRLNAKMIDYDIHLSVPFVCDAGNLNFLSTHGGHNLETLFGHNLSMFLFFTASRGIDSINKHASPLLDLPTLLYVE